MILCGDVCVLFIIFVTEDFYLQKMSRKSNEVFSLFQI
jgi:hypothetical protein